MKATNTLLLSAVLLLSAPAALAQDLSSPKKIEYKDLAQLYPERPIATQSAADGSCYFAISQDGQSIETYSYATGKKSGTLLELSKLKGEHNLKRISGYEVSSTGEHVLIWGNKEPIYRRSYKADHYIAILQHNQILKLSDGGREQEATFAPNGYMVSYVKDNNLFVYKLRYQSSSQVTTDGKFNEIINGIPDWVYEEEFSTSRLYAWSPDSKKLAFVRSDESKVREFSMPFYGASYPTHNDAKLYPTEYRYKYPKAGEVNSTVSVHVYDLGTRVTKEVDLGKGDKYVPRILWTGAQDQLCVVKLNRMQNHMELLAVNANSLTTSPLLIEDEECYVEETTYRSLTFFNEGADFVIKSERDGWMHLYHYGTNGVLKNQVTKGEFDVTELYGVDTKGTTIFYQAAKRSPMQREVYAYNIKKKQHTSIADAAGTNAAEFSADFAHFIRYQASATKVPTYDLCKSNGKVVASLVTNESLANSLKKYDVAYKEFTTVKGADGDILNAWVLKPTDFDPNKKYPVMMFQYSGPDSQEVEDDWGMWWEQDLVGKGYVVFCVDPRGTGARGENFRKCTYQKLGKYESDDQIAAAKEIAKLPYVDGNRIGIYGWSFGGFMSTLCACKSDAFKVSIAVAPVINWRYYDTVYTERYMRRPDQNGSGYDDNSPLSMAAKLHDGTKYLIVAGTADDNVHYQNQMEMVDALVQADKQFDMFCYPNRNHSIYGGNARTHLINMMINYVVKNL